MKTYVSKYSESEYNILKDNNLLGRVIPTASGDYKKDIKLEENLVIEDLKCCGNCSFQYSTCVKEHEPDLVCKKWKFDGYDFEGRNIESLQ